MNGGTGNNSANFRFTPTNPATLTQACRVPADKGVRIYGNTNADWSGCLFSVESNGTVEVMSTGGMAAH
jgi:hypothetical protein